MTLAPQSPDRAALALGLARAGLIQFGRFEQADGGYWPVALRLRWLPSYPDLLADVARALAGMLADVPGDRILTTADATPIGVALGLASGRPVTYPFGQVRDYTAAFAIEGAYDVGHPTVLVADVLTDPAQGHDIMALARRVGLNVTHVLAVIDLGLGAGAALAADGYRVRSLLSLGDMLPLLAEHSFLPGRLYERVQQWVAAGL